MSFRLFKHLALAGLLALAAAGSQAAAVKATYAASLLPTEDPGTVFLDGFGRGAASRIGGPAALAAAPTVAFVDTWNIDVSAIKPGDYTFESAVIDAVGSVRFNAVTFNFVDTVGATQTILFDLFDGGAPVFFNGTQAVGSGAFTVRESCPIASCIWIQLIGTRDATAGLTDYTGDVTAAVVPEPSTYALMALGLLAVGLRARRKARATA